MPLTGIVLAGGAGSRLGGADKGLLLYRGQPLIGHSLHALAQQTQQQMVVANRNLSEYRRHCTTVVHDEDSPPEAPCFNGPLAGMVAGLAACQTPLALFVPADACTLPANLAEGLLAVGAPAYVENLPVCALLARSELPALRAAYAAGQRSPWRWLQQRGAKAVAFPHWLPAQRSINTPTEWAALLACAPAP